MVIRIVPKRPATYPYIERAERYTCYRCTRNEYLLAVHDKSVKIGNKTIISYMVHEEYISYRNRHSSICVFLCKNCIFQEVTESYYREVEDIYFTPKQTFHIALSHPLSGDTLRNVASFLILPSSLFNLLLVCREWYSDLCSGDLFFSNMTLLKSNKAQEYQDCYAILTLFRCLHTFNVNCLCHLQKKSTSLGSISPIADAYMQVAMHTFCYKILSEKNKC
jgi:hypothetical protein